MNKLWKKLFPDKEEKANKKHKKARLSYENGQIYMNSTEDGTNTKFLYDFIKERYDGNRWGQEIPTNPISMEQARDMNFGVPMQPETRRLDGGNLERGFTIEGEFHPIDFTGTQITVEKEKLEVKIELKPIEVIGELERVPTSWSTVGIDEKIIILQEKEELIKVSYAKKEVSGMIERLQNRKKYFFKSKTGETYKEFFAKFDPTTEEKVDDLIKKYPHLTVKESDLFIPEFPDVAIEMMRQYTEKCMELCGKKPNFQVIAPIKMFKEKYKRRDPILLAQSPFGYYFDILGAWDEEMILLSEL